MSIIHFPPVEDADETGLLGIGGHLSTENLLAAYRLGIFPWPHPPGLLAWFAPPERSLIFCSEIHISKSLSQTLKKSNFSYFFNRAFEEVVLRCREVKRRKGQSGTWITDDMISAYTELHKAGFCHSIEAYNEEKLVGGLYGVSIGAFFGGESMFYEESGASKGALIFLCEHLKAHGAKWMDCQVSTPLSRSLGAKEIPRIEFSNLLKEAIALPQISFENS